MSRSVITLLSDLGTGDSTLVVTKAILERHAPGSIFTDISHHVSAFDKQQAAYLFSSAFKHFPTGTIHLLIVDVFGGPDPRMIVAGRDGHFFVAPDNGILSLIFGTSINETRLLSEFVKPFVFNEWVNAAGRAIETIRKGDFTDVPKVELKSYAKIWEPKAMGDGVECNILYIDHFENVTIDITRAQFDKIIADRPFKIRISRTQTIAKISNSYNEVDHGALLCRFNASGYMEIAMNHDKAATLLGLGAYNSGNLQYQTVKISY